jgi:hypothetical protein
MRLVVGSHVTIFAVPSHVNAPVIDGEDDIAPSVALSFIASENWIVMFALTETLVVPFCGEVEITVGVAGPPPAVVKEKG